MPTCLVGLGANLGHREAMLHRAACAIDQLAGVRVTAHSRPVETQAVGGPATQGVYLNAALLLETEATASVLLHGLLEVERNLGRTRGVPWGPRKIDIDLLLHGQTVFESAELTVPHPWMAVRRFVLEPAVEIAPQLRHPQIGWSVQQLSEHLDQGSAYLAVTGCDQELVAQAVREAATHCEGRALWDPLVASRANTTLAESEIVLLEERSRQINRISTVPEARPVISNFWLADALAATTRSKPSVAPRELAQHIERAQSSQVPPWLVILLERHPPAELGTETTEKAKHRRGRHLDPLQLRELVMHTASGPWLKLQVTTAEQAANLIIAAICSRGPPLLDP